MQRLRRLYEEKENVNGFDKEVNSLTGPNYGGYARKKPGIGRYPMGPTNIKYKHQI